ncbi:hypothetical protein FC34_GL000692 [Lacticaseibacillus brantae DSM 23927]|uniref:Uncharacterized protein n=1 Tax=Lacticaseibacillus brantae DSM 23927 TaxID=1423727 RepID=A0A0R2B2K6_9LACO|nr:hypothetical protein FC34_GL000692 [Lacticaseibacillus brantae DSM 23927]
MGLLIAFIGPLNNGARSLNHNQDTAMDTAVKRQVTNRLEAAKTGDPTTDSIIDTSVAKIKQTPMATLMKAADNQQQLTTLLSQATGLPTSVTAPASSSLFQDTDLNAIREDFAAGRWTQVILDSRNLPKNSALSALLQQPNH